MRVHVTGGPAEVLASWSGAGKRCAGADATTHFWNESVGKVYALPFAGGTPKAILHDDHWTCLATDATAVYASSDFGLWKVDKDGSNPVAMASGPVLDLVLDPLYVYYTTGASVWRRPKPE